MVKGIDNFDRANPASYVRDPNERDFSIEPPDYRNIDFTSESHEIKLPPKHSVDNAPSHYINDGPISTEFE